MNDFKDPVVEKVSKVKSILDGGFGSKLLRIVRFLYKIGLILCLPITAVSFSVGFNSLSTDLALSFVSFLIGIVAFVVFMVLALGFFMMLITTDILKDNEKLRLVIKNQNNVVRNQSKEIREMQENAAITLTAATSQLNEIILDMKSGNLVKLSDSEFNKINPNPEPLITVPPIRDFTKEIEKNE